MIRSKQLDDANIREKKELKSNVEKNDELIDKYQNDKKQLQHVHFCLTRTHA